MHMLIAAEEGCSTATPVQIGALPTCAGQGRTQTWPS